MATKKAAEKGMTSGQKIGIGVGVTATMLAAVGGYFLYGAKEAKTNRKKVGSWMLKAKAEVLEGIENAKELTEQDYDKLVDDVMKGYKAARKASVKELAEFANEMKNNWKKIKAAGPEKKISIPVTAAKAPKKAVKKTSKK
jgi:uncharacterized protein YpuA (DUF1002 family)